MPLNDLTVDPKMPEWSSLLKRGAVDAESKRFREQLGLAGDKPVIFSGHQAGVWHPGILAKWLAAGAAAEKFGAQAAWVVVDQDANDAAAIRFPAKAERNGAGGSGDLPVAETWHSAAGASAEWIKAEAPTGLIPAFEVRAVESGMLDRSATPSVREGLERVRGALTARRAEASGARQVHGAVEDILKARGLASEHSPRAVYATSLSKTDLFAAWVECMKRDPLACARCYNAAVEQIRAPGVRPLAISEKTGRTELPLWELIGGSGGIEPRRKVVFADMLASLPLERLAPRGLMMSAMLRAAGCEVFIHGLGGGASARIGGVHAGYDRVSEAWIKAWLGREIAPSVVVTATVRMAMGRAASVSEAEAAAAKVGVHRAMHAPSLLGDDALQSRKDELVAEIKVASGDRAKRQSLYFKMHALLEEGRKAHAGGLEAMGAKAAAMGQTLKHEAVLSDRTWSWAMYPDDDLRALLAEIQKRTKAI